MLKKFVLMIAASAALCVNAVPLFDEGTTNWKICIPEKASETEIYAADELAAYLKKASGAEFSVTKKVDGANVIYVGTPDSSAKIKDAAVKLKLNSGNEQKLAVYTLNGKLYLAGNTPRGALFAVYTFLREGLGVRWFWPENEPDGEFVPLKKRYDLPELAINFEPVIKYRGYHFLNGTDRKLESWLARNFGNVIRHGVAGGPKRMAERKTRGFYTLNSGHNVDPEAVFGAKNVAAEFKKRPGIFAEVQEKPSKEHFCWNNPEVFELVCEYADKIMQKYPGVDVLGFYPSDTQNYCECKKCSGKTISDNWFGLVNRLKERIGKKYPGLKFSSIAYQGYIDYPNVPMTGYEFVEYAPYGRCYVHTMASGCEKNSSSLKTWKKWLQSKEVPGGVYSYVFDVFEPAVIIHNYYWLEDYLHFLAKNKVICVIPEVNGTWSSKVFGTPRQHMRLSMYLYSQLMWNPNAAVDELIRDYCSYVFPGSKNEMMKYFTDSARKWINRKGHFTGYSNSPVSGMSEVTPEEIENTFGLFEKAFAKAVTEREKKEITYERNVFSRIVKYAWQHVPSIMNVPSGEPAKYGRLELKWNPKVLSAGKDVRSIELTDSTGMSLRGKEGVVNGKFSPGDILRLSVVFADGSRETVMIYLNKTDRVKHKLLLVKDDDPQYARNMPAVRNVLMNAGWQVDVADFTVGKFDGYDLIAVRMGKEKQNAAFYRELKKFVRNGGRVILSSDRNLKFEKIFDDPSFKLVSTGVQQYSWKLRKTQTVVSGEWLTKPMNLKKALDTYCTPEYGYEIPSGSAWKSLATMRKANGSTAPYILEMPYGKGFFYLTTGSLGLSHDGLWMTFGSSHNDSTAALLSNLCIKK